MWAEDDELELIELWLLELESLLDSLDDDDEQRFSEDDEELFEDDEELMLLSEL
jgi:hypothetical protein